MDAETRNSAIVPSLEGVPSTSQADAGFRCCQHCFEPYPLDQFRHRRRGQDRRVNECRACHNYAERLRRHRQRGWLTKRQFNQCLTSLKNQRTARGVERVFLDLVQQFGGTDGLVSMWTAAMTKDVAEGGFRAYRHIASIIRLMQHYESSQPDKPDYSTMSDEELLDRLASAQLEMPPARSTSRPAAMI